MFAETSFLSLLLKGGAVMAVLALCSVASIAVALERFWRFRRFRSEIKSAGEKLESVIEKGGLSAGAAHAAAGTSALHDLYLSAYSKRDLAREEQLGAMELTARLYLSGLERFLGVLGTIGSTAPFIGLFGTVLGIIRAFSDLAAAEGAGGASVVADGIAEALVATAAGLFVAVPAVVAYNYFVRALGRLSVELECAAVSLVDAMAESKKRGQQ